MMAQSNLINGRAIQQMNWQTQHCRVRIVGISGDALQPHTKKLSCQLLSRFNDSPLATIELIISPAIAGMWVPQSPIPNDVIPAMLRDKLADPEAPTPAQIDMVLGAGVWAIIIQDGGYTDQQGIALQPTRLGWVIFGGGIQTRDEVTVAMATSNESETQLDTLLRRFWEPEEVEVARTRTQEQEKCEEIFMRTHLRLADGRFQVNIPLRNDIEQLASSRAIALHRFRQLERRFQRDPELKRKYSDAVAELMHANHMQLADRLPGPWCYHIPHHPVLKKFRVVNDASCLTDRGISINEVQLIGEKLQDDLANLIMRFRCHRVAVTADIHKMWDLQRIFWRPTADSEIQEYWLTVVTFGMASAPHCAVRAMIQGPRDGQARFPMGAAAIEHDFYMDDCLTGAHDEATARQLCQEIHALLRTCGFSLHRWRSNCRNIVPSGDELQVGDTIELSESDDTTVLGLRWSPKSDELLFRFQPPTPLENSEATKRNVLSHIAKIFDAPKSAGMSWFRTKYSRNGNNFRNNCL